ncbi:SDR family NAD(P)-dependent oxidoreductase [Massilia arenosa]|uniref:SDR family NAD(P)-dependent oxidoreductase n=1 Tax=Zemynaea arenosa TaxID=2561931 RepID=A0A4Y9SHA5_9BURK|nr:SDR family oxidoreductase [Massilia arenosa]TFW24037.1 SDR family NAD(P)-dependent oxidoreductase [Massilia arenosa]
MKLKKLSDQVVLITGASSGIGLTTARMAAKQGARLVLVSRDQDALDQLAEELRQQGIEALACAADVGNQEDVQRVAQQATERFGRIDTWINNAGISIFGKHEEIALEDAQRLFQTNFWGVVHGSLEAVRIMKERGGALINLGSEVSDRAVPLQGMYSASKHAVKGFTDSLRMELEKDKLPISVTLIRPAAIDTMFTVHAKNYMDKEPALPPPIYAPELVADAILYAAQHPKRDVFVGGASKAVSVGSHHMPRVFDKYMEMSMFKQQQSEQMSSPNRRDALHAPDPDNALRQRNGANGHHVAEHCPYTAVSLRSKPILLTALIGGAALLGAWSYQRRGGTLRSALAAFR